MADSHFKLHVVWLSSHAQGCSDHAGLSTPATDTGENYMLLAESTLAVEADSMDSIGS